MMWVPLTLLLVSFVAVSGTVTRFTNIQCEALDPSFCAFKKCNLKVLGRGIVASNIQAILLTGFFNNAKVNLSLWRKYNGFRPFMFNTTFDFCQFMLKRTTKLSFEKIVIDIVAENSNINHTCPYDHDLIANNVVFKEDFLKYFPIPSGEYKLQIIAGTNNKWRARASFYFIRKEDLLQS